MFARYLSQHSSAFSAETIVKKLISDIWSIIKYMSMKQVYSYLFLVLLVFSSVNAKADTPVKINIDDVNRVTVKVNYVPVADLAMVQTRLTYRNMPL